MIITRTPLRISFVGGGSDLPWFYQEEPGTCVAATINKYVYVAVKPEFTGRVLAHYRATEDVAHVGELRHDRMRACLLSAGIRDAIEVMSMADVPGSTGLGSSSAFTVGLLHALRPGAMPESYAAHACQIEIDDCGASIGKQDQYTAAHGGLNLLRFDRDRVSVEPIACDLEALGAHLLLFDTGTVRQDDAGRVLVGQRQDRDDVRRLARLAHEFAASVEQGLMRNCGEVLDQAWIVKQRYVGTPQIDEWYAAALAAGAWGGKLCGAGGGGFLLFLAPPERHAAIVEALWLRHVPIVLVSHGSQVIYAA